MRNENITEQSWTVQEIANKLNVTDATVRVWINSGKLKALKLPGSGSQPIIRIEHDEFERFLKSNTVCA
jgi:excisionase family DNA binding protein